MTSRCPADQYPRFRPRLWIAQVQRHLVLLLQSDRTAECIHCHSRRVTFHNLSCRRILRTITSLAMGLLDHYTQSHSRMNSRSHIIVTEGHGSTRARRWSRPCRRPRYHPTRLLRRIPCWETPISNPKSAARHLVPIRWAGYLLVFLMTVANCLSVLSISNATCVQCTHWKNVRKAYMHDVQHCPTKKKIRAGGWESIG